MDIMRARHSILLRPDVTVSLLKSYKLLPLDAQTVKTLIVTSRSSASFSGRARESLEKNFIDKACNYWPMNFASLSRPSLN